MASLTLKPLYPDREPLTEKELAKAMTDFEAYCLETMIPDKNGKLVKVVLNEAQKVWADLFFSLVMSSTPVPFTILTYKSRQMGISTVHSLAINFLMGKVSNYGVAYVMPDEDTARSFLESKYRPMVEGLHPQLMPKVEKYKKGDLFYREWDPDTRLNNRVFPISARAKAAGRSQTLQGAVLDEYAYYQDAVSFERGLLATLPKTGRAFTLIPSTPNGMNHFKDLWDQKASSVYKLFLPWHMLKEYEMEVSGRMAFDEHELTILEELERLGYPKNSWRKKIAWYRYTLNNEGRGSLEYMRENYPTTEQEGFLSSGRPAFPAKDILPLQIGKPFVNVEVSERHDLVPVKDSSIKIFTTPPPGHHYVIGVDTSEGGESGDPSAACILDTDTLEVAASVKELAEQHDLAEVVVKLARYYNKAKLIPERNRGVAFIDWCKRLGYTNILLDPTSTRSNLKYGVYMSKGVRNDLIQDLKYLLSNGMFKDYDDDFHQEAFHFVMKRNKFQADSGWTDDVVMSRLLAISGLNMDRIHKQKEEGKWKTNTPT